jgi:hypothetical protein
MAAHPTDGPDWPRLEERGDGPDLAARHDDVGRGHRRGRAQRRGRRRGRCDGSRRHQASTGPWSGSVARPVVREPGRVAHLVQQDDAWRDTRHRAAVQEDHRCRSGGPAGQAGTAGEGCRGPHRAPDDHDERRPHVVRRGDDRTPARRRCTWRDRLARLDQHARQVWPREHEGIDPAMGDAVASEACERLVEHGPIARCGPGETPRAAVAGGRPGHHDRVTGPGG